MNILATSGGFRPGVRSRVTPGPLIDFAFHLAGSPRRPRFCYLGTAAGDSLVATAAVYEAFVGRDVVVSHLALFPMPNVDDVRAHLLGQDVIWVGGGSVAGLLTMWRLHGLDEILREAWHAGVVLAGVSAGSLCWHVGGTTDSFGPELRPVTDGLGLLPYSNGVHYDSEEQRRPLLHRLVGDGTLPPGYATEDGVGLHYRGTELAGVVADTAGRAAYHIVPDGCGGAIETPIEPLLLGRQPAVGGAGSQPTSRSPTGTQSPPDHSPGDPSPGDVVTAINAAWLAGRPHDMAMLLHDDVVMVRPDLERRVAGREACLRGYADFAANATVREFVETDRDVHLVGDAAVVAYRYTVVYEKAGARSTGAGRDVFVLARSPSGWQATWRMLLHGDQPAALGPVPVRRPGAGGPE